MLFIKVVMEVVYVRIEQQLPVMYKAYKDDLESYTVFRNWTLFVIVFPFDNGVSWLEYECRHWHRINDKAPN